MLMNKKWKLPVLLSAFAVMLAACDTGGNGQTGEAGTDSQQTVSFTIAYAAGDTATTQAISAAIKAFMAANPQVHIQDTSEISSNAYLDWLKIKDAVGEFPDLVEMRDTEAFADAGKIVPLPSGLAELFDQPPEVDGQVWNAPLFGNAPQGIIYSKKAYADAGITELPQTYAQFLQIQEKLLASGITPLVVGGKDIFHLGFWINKFMIDDVYAKDPDWNAKRTAGQVSFTDANVVQGMSDFKYLFTHYVNEGWRGIGDNQTASFLISGKAAQLFSGTWMFPQIKAADPAFEFGFYAVPDREGAVNVVGLPLLTGWSLSAEAAKDPAKTQAIADFIRFFYTPEQYSSFLKSVDGIPVTKAKVTYPASEQMLTVLDLISDPQVTKSRAMNSWWGDNLLPQQFRNWYYKLLQEMVIEDGDVLSYMKQADEEYDRQVLQEQQ